MGLKNVIVENSKRAEEGWGRAYPLFSRVLNNFGLKTGVEIGVAFGGHSEAMLRQTRIEKLYGVDPYRHFNNYDDPMNLPQSEFDTLYEFTKSRLAPFDSRFELLRETSSMAANIIEDKIDFIYIDALHTYEGIQDDLKIWFIKVRDGGIIGGHDYGHSNFPGVKRAVDEFFLRFGWEVHEEGEGVWWVEKKALNISFIIPAFNCEATISETVESIINGNLSDGDEIVICNDGSTDGTANLIKKVMQKHHFVKAVTHRCNRGGGGARNTAVDNSANLLLFCLDSDNILAPGSIKRLKEFMITSGADVASFQELRYFNQSKEQITHKWVFREGRITLADTLAGKCVPAASGNYMFTKNSWFSAGGYPEFARALDAWGFGVRQLASGAKMAVMPQSFYYHRYGHDSYWVRESEIGKISLTALQILIPYIDQFDVKDINYMVSPQGRFCWFDNIDKHPIKLKSGEIGRSGIVVQSNSNSLPSCTNSLTFGFINKIFSQLIRRLK